MANITQTSICYDPATYAEFACPDYVVQGPQLPEAPPTLVGSVFDAYFSFVGASYWTMSWLFLFGSLVVIAAFAGRVVSEKGFGGLKRFFFAEKDRYSHRRVEGTGSQYAWWTGTAVILLFLGWPVLLPLLFSAVLFVGLIGLFSAMFSQKARMARERRAKLREAALTAQRTRVEELEWQVDHFASMVRDPGLSDGLVVSVKEMHSDASSRLSAARAELRRLEVVG